MDFFYPATLDSNNKRHFVFQFLVALIIALPWNMRATHAQIAGISILFIYFFFGQQGGEEYPIRSESIWKCRLYGWAARVWGGEKP